MNAESVAWVIVLGTQLYLLLGLLFALPFVLFLAGRIDPAAKQSTWEFRLLIIPSVCLLWPLLLARVLKNQPPPKECNAHRRRAQALVRSQKQSQDDMP